MLILFVFSVAFTPNLEAAPHRAPTPIRDIYTILFVLDGCRGDIFYHLLDRGELPNIQRWIVAPGVRFNEAITVFPSATVNAYQSMVSGLFPAHAGIPYLTWLQRKPLRVHEFMSLRGPAHLNASFRNFYLSPRGATRRSTSLYDDLSDYPTAAIYTQFYRHARIRAPLLPIHAAWDVFARHEYLKLDPLAMHQLKKLFAQSLRKIPRFSLVSLLGTDSIGHHLGPTHPDIATNLKQFDAQLGDFVDQLHQRELWDRTYIVITSDHGMHALQGMFDLPRLLAQHGLHLLRHPRYRRANVFVGARGISTATMTLRGARGWRIPITLAELRAYPVANHGESTRRNSAKGALRGRLHPALPVEGATRAPEIDVVDLLRTDPHVELLLVRDGDRVRVWRGMQEGMLQQHRTPSHTLYSYDARRDDPLQLRRYAPLRKFLHGQALPADVWNRLLAHTQTPGIVPGLAHIFSDGRVGDIVVIADPAFDFFQDKRGTHGTAHREDMHVPLVMRGPGLAPAVRDAAQVTDLYPTMQRWFGLPQRLDLIDGRPLFE